MRPGNPIQEMTASWPFKADCKGENVRSVLTTAMFSGKGTDSVETERLITETVKRDLSGMRLHCEVAPPAGLHNSFTL